MNPVILHIETSAEICSVALSEGTKCITVKESDEGKNHARLLTLFIEDILNQYDFLPDAISVSSGPGSYTGLRIGVSAAKGIAYGLGIPLLSVSTLQAMCYGFTQQNLSISKDVLLCPMIDARRMEVYTALFDINGNMLNDISAEIITGESFSELLANNYICFFGDGAMKAIEIIKHPNALFFDNYRHSACYAIEPALKAYHTKKFEDVAYFEPFYLKDFIAGKSKLLLDELIKKSK